MGRTRFLTTDDPEEGWSWVRDEIDSGRPSLVWGDIAELPYLKVQMKMSRHDIVVIGYDEEAGVAFVVDNDWAEVQERFLLTRGLGPGLRCRSRRPWSTNDNRGWNPNPCL
ncbi:putative transposase (plasmid) [Rhodococcus erythropolis PR4]|uniref:Putative transposase n=1 Tax=Rhodococcus erythropolis (strain PR4 / NBRC 100887) TaxID=234621 RepID=Q3L9D1_RHOE4|nr:putative transposase [Rhodococcus erythropolis PR4]